MSNLKSNGLLACLVITCGFSLSSRAQTTPFLRKENRI